MGRMILACIVWAVVMAGQPVLGQTTETEPVIVETTPASEPQVTDEDEGSGGRILRYALIGAVVGGLVGAASTLFKKKPKA